MELDAHEAASLSTSSGLSPPSLARWAALNGGQAADDDDDVEFDDATVFEPAVLKADDIRVFYDHDMAGWVGKGYWGLNEKGVQDPFLAGLARPLCWPTSSTT